MRSKMVGIDACMSANKEQVIQQIIKYIYEIKPAIHKNIRVDWLQTLAASPFWVFFS